MQHGANPKSDGDKQTQPDGRKKLLDYENPEGEKIRPRLGPSEIAERVIVGIVVFMILALLLSGW